MASRRDYYYRQLVTEAELDAGFNGLEQAERNIMADLGLIGVVSGASVSQHSPTPDLTVDVAGSSASYDQLGQRIAIGSLQTLDMSVDSNNVSTSVTTPGNEKWVSIFAKFTRSLSDPRLDGNLSTVYFVRDESVMLIITQAAEGAIGVGPLAALRSDALLLADVNRVNGQTQILDADISIDRREDAFVLSAGSMDVRAGTPEAAVGQTLTHLNNHVTGVSNKHPASAIDYTSGPSWAGGTSPTNPAATVEAQLDKIITDLSATTSGASGADRIGGGALVGVSSTIAAGTLFAQLGALKSAANLDLGARTTWLGGRVNAAATLFAGIDKIITDLAATTTSDDGAERIGAAATGSFSSGSVRSQLDALDTTRAKLAGAAFTGQVEFGSGLWPALTGFGTQTRQMPLRVSGRLNATSADVLINGSDPSFAVTIKTKAANAATDYFTIDLEDIPEGARILTVAVVTKGLGGNAAPFTPAVYYVDAFDMSSSGAVGAATTLGSANDVHTYGGGGNWLTLKQTTTISCSIHTVRKDSEVIRLKVDCPNDVGSGAQMELYSVIVTYTLASMKV